MKVLPHFRKLYDLETIDTLSPIQPIDRRHVLYFHSNAILFSLVHLQKEVKARNRVLYARAKGFMPMIRTVGLSIVV